MLDYKTYFSGKKITLMGLGLLGRGVGDAKFLAEAGADLVVTDLKSKEELKSSLKKLKKFKNIKFILGQHRLEDFRNRDLIIKAAGVPLDSPFIAEAKKNKIPVAMSTALFAKLSGATIVGITGTRGKSTTTQLIYEILNNVGSRTSNKRVWLGGNVVGVSTLALLKKVKPTDLVVLELDSWQLQGFGDFKISPHIAVFTNFLPDHLNYYKGNMKRYFADKANIFKYQKKGDYLFKGGEVPSVPKNWKVKLPGEHNLKNIALAIAVAKTLKVPLAVIKKTVANFGGVPGRLELVRSASWRRRGIKIYNDTTATTPTATLVALRALAKNKNIVLIAGGADKKLEMGELLEVLPKFCKKIILLPGSGTDKVKILNAILVKNLKEAVAEALKYCVRGDILLLSPAFASFGPPPGGFKNEFDRGAQFNRLIEKLA